MTIRAALSATTLPLAFDNAPVATYNPTPGDVAAARQARSTTTVNEDVMLRRSKDSAAMVEYWDLTDAIVDGIGALRAEGPKYLPKFADKDDESYKSRLKQTKLTNIYRDTVEGLASKPFEEECSLGEDDQKEPPEQLLEFAENVDGSGNNLTIFSAATFFNGINSAIDWIFVDMPKADPTIRSVADANRAGLRPYWSHVLGRNILDVQSAVIGGNEILTFIKILEPGSPDHIRVFVRDPNGVISWSLYEKRDQWRDYELGGRTQFHPIDEGTMTIDVIPLVPFATGRRDGRSWRYFPAMRDAADLQIELYQQESALKWIKTLSAYPMLSGNGVKADVDEQGKPKKLAIGPARVLYAPPNGDGQHGEWLYVQPNADVLTFLANDVQNTIKELRELGRQPLTAQSGNLTVITTAVAAGKSKSAVKAWALNLKNALENALLITCNFMAIKIDDYDAVVNVYTEFDEFLDGKDLDALAAARKNGDLSQETYWEELRRRSVLQADFDPEIERERLLAETPGDGVDTGNINDPPPNDPEPMPAPMPSPAPKPQPIIQEQ